MARGQLGAVVRQIQNLLDRSGADALTDADLLHRFVQDRDEAAFTALVRRHGGLVLNVCRNVVRHDADAQDAFQATFLVLARQAASIRKGTSGACWLHGVAFRTAMNIRKSAMRRHRYESNAKEGRAPASPVSEAALREVQAILDEELQGLPERCRAPFILCCLEGKSRSEAAQALGWKEGTVSSRLARARALLQERLTARGVALSAALCATALSQNATRAAVTGSWATATTNAALIFATGKTAGAVSAHVIATAEGVMQAMFLAKLKSGIALAFFLGIVAVGALVAQPESAQQDAKKATEPKPPIRAAADVGEPTKEKQVRMDAFGDPLPDGAAARLGTRRFRHDGEAKALAFTADGKTLVGYTESGIIIWDATTGIERYRLPLLMPNHASGMDISPDGKTLAISEAAPAGETRVSLWDLQRGKKTSTLSLPKEESLYAQFGRICFAADGKSLAVSYTNGGKAVVFDLASGQVRASFGGRDSQTFYNLAISPHSNMLAAAVNPQPNAPPTKHAVKLWDIATGKMIRVFQELPPMSGESFVRSIAFSSDGTMLAIGVVDTILLFDPATGRKLGQWEAKKMGQITDLAFTPDCKKLVSAGESDGAVRIWDVASGQALHVLRGRMFVGRSMALSPDGKTVALGTVGHTVRLWDVATAKELFTDHIGHDSQINSLVFSPNGKTLISAGDYRQIYLWDLASRKRVGILPGSAQQLSVSPDGKLLATIAANSTNSARKVQIWDVDAAKQVVAITIPGTDKATMALSAIFSPDGRELITLDYTGYGKHSVRRWKLPTGEQEEWSTIQGEGSWSTDLSSDGKNVLAAHTSGMHIYNMESGQTRLLRSPQLQRYCTLSPDGRVVASSMASPDSGTRLCEVVTGKGILLLNGHSGSVSKIAWSSDSRLIATSDEGTGPYLMEEGESQTVRLWDVATGKQLAKFGGFKTNVTALTFSPDGTTLVAGLRDSTILVWDVSKVTSTLMPSPKLSKNELAARWTDLISENAGQAHQAIGVLVGAPKQAMPFIRDQVKPSPVTDPGKIQRWIADLDSDTFAVRQLAMQELAKADTQADAPIQKALKENASLETCRRLEQVLSKISDAPDAEIVRMVRAITALERIGSPEARVVLEALARGAPSARGTHEAAASLRRLAAR